MPIVALSSIRIFKAGFVISGSAGSGVLNFHGRNYPLSVGGLSYGFTFGASETRFHGTVSNIRRPSDIAGVYGQAGVGAAVIRGAQAVVLTNQNARCFRSPAGRPVSSSAPTSAAWRSG